MRIINYDAEKNDALKCMLFEPFVLDVVRHLEVQSLDPSTVDEDLKDMLYAPIRFFAKPEYENVAKMIHTIPIYLSSSPKLVEEAICEGKDALGSYCYWKIPYLSPFIVLYPKEIFSAAEKYKELYGERAYKWLFTKVLLHELGHAVMDFRNCQKYYNCDDKLADWKAREVIEESMANAIMLRIIKGYKECGDYKEMYLFVKTFCRNEQDAKYALGVALEEAEDFGNKKIAEYHNAKAEGLKNAERYDWEDYLSEIAKKGNLEGGIMKLL